MDAGVDDGPGAGDHDTEFAHLDDPPYVFVLFFMGFYSILMLYALKRILYRKEDLLRMFD